MQRMPTMPRAWNCTSCRGDARRLLGNGNGNERIPWIVLWQWTNSFGKFRFCKTFFSICKTFLKSHFSGLECVLSFIKNINKQYTFWLFCSEQHTSEKFPFFKQNHGKLPKVAGPMRVAPNAKSYQTQKSLPPWQLYGKTLIYLLQILK